jgi:hypothetical protein
MVNCRSRGVVDGVSCWPVVGGGDGNVVPVDCDGRRAGEVLDLSQCLPGKEEREGGWE